MRREDLEEHLSGLEGSEGSYPFGPEALVFKVMDKMFALVSQTEGALTVTLKCDPTDGEFLVGQYESITPGYYMNKKHWITISLDGELPQEMITDLADGSYELVVGKLTRAEKRELEQRQQEDA